MSKLLKPLIIASLLLPIAACKVGPDYERPLIELPAEFRQGLSDTPNMLSADEAELQLEQSLSESSLAFTDWNAIYQDKYLQGYIEAALTSNLDLAITRSRYNQATLNARQVGASLWPAFGVRRSAFGVRRESHGR